MLNNIYRFVKSNYGNLIIFRCEALDFRISKSQKKILKRMIKFLRNELTNDNVGDIDEDQQDNIGKLFRILRKFVTFTDYSLVL